MPIRSAVRFWRLRPNRGVHQSREIGRNYWVTATQSMQAAAKSLGMAFEVQYAQREPLKTLEIARELVARPAGKRPEYIVITDDYAVADQLLKIIDDAGVKTFLAYSSIPVDQRSNTGSPRGKYKGWLGSLEPRAEDAGYMTARALIDRGKREKAFGADGKLHMLAIAGDRSTPSSINRNQGMRRAIGEDARVVLKEEVYAAWSRELGNQQAESLYRRYPDAKLVWASRSETMNPSSVPQLADEVITANVQEMKHQKVMTTN